MMAPNRSQYASHVVIPVVHSTLIDARGAEHDVVVFFAKKDAPTVFSKNGSHDASVKSASDY